MATYTDDFNRTDNATTLGAGWTNRNNVYGITSNAAVPQTSNADAVASWDATTMAAGDFTITLTIGAKVGEFAPPFGVLVGDTSGNCVWARGNINGSDAVIGTTSASFDPGAITSRGTGTFTANSVGDTLVFTRVGTLYTLKQGTTSRATWNDTGAVIPIDSTHSVVMITAQLFIGTYWPIDTLTVTENTSAPANTGRFFAVL